MTQKLTLLFLCTGNSCRSQMAEGFARALKSDQLTVFSAGIEAHGLNDSAVLVMKEAGVDISTQTSNTVSELKNKNFDFVITLCDNARDTCPTIFGNHKTVHKPFQDPFTLAKEVAANGGDKEAQLNCYRKIRDEIKAYITSLPESLNNNKPKGFFGRLFEKLDTKLKAESKKASCCGSKDGGSSCC